MSWQHLYNFGACVRAEVKEAATQLEVRVRDCFSAGVVSGGWPFGMEERGTEWVWGLLAPCTCHWVWRAVHLRANDLRCCLSRQAAWMRA